MAENDAPELPRASNCQNGNVDIDRGLFVHELEQARHRMDEQLIRRTPHLMFIRDFCDEHLSRMGNYNRILDTEIWTNRNINSLLTITPVYFIIFCDVRIRAQQRHFDFMADKFQHCEDCFYYKAQVPRDGCIILTCAQYVTTRIPFVKINAMILPRLRALEPRIITITYNEAKLYHQADAEIPDEYADRFFPRRRGKCCLILLENRLYDLDLVYNDTDYSMFRERFFRKLEQRFVDTDGTVIWGGRISTYIPSRDKLDDRPFFTGILIETGSAQFFSATLSGKIGDSEEGTCSKLEAFHEQIRPHLMNYSIGLHLYHETVFDHHISTMMQVMPQVKFVSMCLPMNNDAIMVDTIFSSDSTLPARNQRMKHLDDYMALLVFTYD